MNTRSDSVRGRGSHIDPPNRFERVHAEDDFEQVEHDGEFLESLEHAETEYLVDQSQSVVTENDSPDVGFRYSLNPYRGCSHGCSYCYARPSHEYLGLSAGLDFERKILVKHDAPELLRKFLTRPAWRGELIMFSGVTDCYQPAERQFRLTRRCLEVAHEAGQPMAIITKNALVLRDLDLLAPMAARGCVQVSLSVTTLDAKLARTMEPRTSSPEARLRAIRELSAAGIPTRVMVAPIVPGLTDREVPAILEAAAAAGARSAGFVMLRLPWTVAPVFREWLARSFPDRAEHIEQLIRSMRGGKLYDSRWGVRGRGTGPLAEQVEKMFHVFAKKHALDGPLPELTSEYFQRPSTGGQLRLFN